ncbi:MAG: bifunctional diguanylate cyclase/phosphodiesterase [Pseudomonadota bacterium]
MAFGLLDITSSFRPEDDEQISSVEATQRRRLITGNVLAIAITAVVSTIELFVEGVWDGVIHFAFGLLAIAAFAVSLRLAKRHFHVNRHAQIWIAAASASLWADLVVSGGIAHHTSYLLLLLPVGSGLLLGVRDIILAGVANVLAIIVMLQFGPQGDIDPAELISRAMMLAIVSASLTFTTAAMVAHHYRIDAALRRLLQRTTEAARIDGLTGLSNRLAANEKLQSLNSDRDTCDVFLLDLDKFKDINDAYGHSTGDALLIEASKRLRKLVGDDHMIARLGGDEFLVLAGNQRPSLSGDMIVAAFSDAFEIGELKLNVSCSVGRARFPEDALMAEDLLTRADLALYAAKRLGRNRNCEYRQAMEDQHRKRLRVRERLHLALRNGDVHPHYQPKIDVRTRKPIALEALARWHDEELGDVPASDFISIAEECGLIDELGEQILRKACRDAASWQTIEGEAPISVAVNVSPIQLGRSDYVDNVRLALEAAKLPPQRLELEITESVLIADPDKTASTLRHLNAMGVSITMDDFGRGYSSLSYLQALPIETLKIDRFFVENLFDDSNALIVNASLQLARALGIQVVAEGVETEDQHNMLKAMGCRFAQGLHYAPVIAARDVAAFLASSQTDNTELKVKADAPDDEALKRA